MEQNLRNLFGLMIELKDKGLEHWWSANFRKIDDTYLNSMSRGIMFRCINGSVHVTQKSIKEGRECVDKVSVIEITTVEDMLDKFKESCDKSSYESTRLDVPNDRFRNILLETEESRAKYMEASRYKDKETRDRSVKEARDVLIVVKDYLKV